MTAPAPRATVLIVDDAPEYLLVLGDLLAPHYDVRAANAGRRALEVAFEAPAPDAILLDVVLGDMSGFDVLAALRADPRTAETPVLLVTSLDATEDEERGLLAGASDYLVKPIRAPIVLARIALHLELKRARDRLREHLDALAAEVGRRREAEAAVQALNAELKARSTALEHSIGDLEAFAYSVSHDLRAPLRAIAGFSQLLAEGEADRLTDEGRGLLARVKAAALRMSGMIDDILAYSRVQSRTLELRAVDLNALAADVVAELAPAHPATAITLGALPALRCDRSMMRQVLANLIGNALKFSQRSPAPKVDVHATVVDGAPQIEVSDNGAGFDPALADRLFGLFQRLHTQQEYPGSGVGLAIVKRLLDRHGGRIVADARLGEGAWFRFTLPPEALVTPPPPVQDRG